ncbi:restriction endonuclease subunit S [Campylobacter coli]|nr:restriction endonuclease subunit S [Campylobacter coli]EGP7860762.1 restriction endonuclease subunit S [Campylobacter jejuni]
MMNCCEVKKLGDIAEISSGGTPSRSKKEYWDNGTIPWVKIKDIKEKFISTTEEFITEDGLKNSSAKLFKKGTLLYSIFATLGEVAILDIDATTNQAIAGINIKENNINSLYLMYFLRSIKDEISNKGRGVAQNNLNLSILKQIEIPLPPLKEQERIVGILDESFAKIDESIKILEQDLLNLDELMQSALQKAFNPLKDNAKENYKLPQGWKMETLGEILSSDKYSIKRGPFGSSLKKSFFVEKGIRIFEQYNPINNDPHWKRYFISHEKFKELEAFKATEGDLLISCSGTLGKIVELPKDTEMGIINQALLKIRLNNIKILNSYFIYYFNSPIIQEKILESTLGSAIKNIASVKILKQIEIPLPPLKEQEQIASHLDELSSHVKNLKQNYQAQIKDLQELKNSLLDKAFKGNL